MAFICQALLSFWEETAKKRVFVCCTPTGWEETRVKLTNKMTIALLRYLSTAVHYPLRIAPSKNLTLAGIVATFINLTLKRRVGSWGRRAIIAFLELETKKSRRYGAGDR
jgi:hypothetical protein